MDRKKKAVVIGAGLGGMALALRLAAKGWSTTICERSPSPGGKMNRWTSEGFVFDTGPSLITMPDVFEELYQTLGTDLREHVELMALTRPVRYLFDDGMQLCHSSSLPEWLEVVRGLEGRTDGFLDYMALGARLYAISKATFFSRSPLEPPDRNAMKVLSGMPVFRGWGNYHKEMCHFIKSPYLRMIFDRYATYVGSSPYRLPGTLCVVPYVEYALGGWHVRGGLYEIVQSLCGLMEQLGVELRLNTPVVEISHSDRRIQGVRLADGERLDADVVIMNGDVSMAGPMLGLPSHRACPANERSLSGVVFLFALKNRHPDWHHQQVLFSKDYAMEFSQLFDERRFPDDPTVYVNIPSIIDRSMTPNGGEVMFAMVNAPANAEEWNDDATRRVQEQVLRRMRASGFPDFQDEIATSDVWTPARLQQIYDMPGGAIYGRNSHRKRHAFLRPFNKDLRIRGMYYVGGSTHPGGGTPTVLMSARITANLVERYEG